MNLEALSDFSTACAAIAAFAAAYASWKSVNIMKQQQDNMIAPSVGLIHGYTWSQEKLGLRAGTYPCFLVLENLGLGPASIFVVDLDQDDILCDISTPINIGPKAQTQLQFWLEKANIDYKIRLGIYYWDLNDNCYGTQWSMIIRYHSPLLDQPIGVLDWRISSEKFIRLEKKRPFQMLHWYKGRELFDDSLLHLDTFSDSPNLSIPESNTKIGDNKKSL